MSLGKSELDSEQTVSADLWDAIVVGGGMGGGATAFALSRAGHKVLLLEKGLSSYESLDIKYHAREPEDPVRRLQVARWPERLRAVIGGQIADIWPPLGCGLGGSTALYGATLERLDPADFLERPTPHGETVGWPFSYAEMEPYYREVESMFGVCGTVDPLETGVRYELQTPPPMNPCDAYLFSAMERATLHPYRLHVAIDYLEGSQEHGGRNARNVWILPAQSEFGLVVQDQSEVTRLVTGEGGVREVLYSRHGQSHAARARIVILAAGAYFTPVLLLRSACAEWPSGLGNKNDLVGRNLMFHTSDFFAVWSRQRAGRKGTARAIGVRDLYRAGDQRLGQLQSTGLTAGYENVLHALFLRFDVSPLRKLRVLRHFLRIPAKIAAFLLKEATVFANVLEDHPYPDNRIRLDKESPNGMRFEYQIRSELRERVQLFRQLLKKKLKGLTVMSLLTSVNLNFGHPCGTCRAGNNPETSVVDKECRIHGIANLYVVDAAIFPTSGGTNPSATIAANALRVASLVSTRLRSASLASTTQPKSLENSLLKP